MKLDRTTLRLKPNLKREAQRLASQQNTTLQEIFNRALENYLKNQQNQKVRQIVFQTHDLGEPLDNLQRKDYYTDDL